MKSKIKILGIIAFAVIIGFSMTACDPGSSGPSELVLSNTVGDVEYILTMGADVSASVRSVYTPRSGDRYRLEARSPRGTSVSIGVVVDVPRGAVFVLRPDGSSDTFRIQGAIDTITRFIDAFNFNDGLSNNPPQTVNANFNFVGNWTPDGWSSETVTISPNEIDWTYTSGGRVTDRGTYILDLINDRIIIHFTQFFYGPPGTGTASIYILDDNTFVISGGNNQWGQAAHGTYTRK